MSIQEPPSGEPEQVWAELRHHVAEILQAQAETREQAVEQAIQTGTCGVLEVVHPDYSVSFQVTERIPFGQIYVVHERAISRIVERGGTSHLTSPNVAAPPKTT